MGTFVIERNIPAASQLTHQQLKEIATASNAVVDSLGVAYRWHHTYVAGDKLYCIHETDDADTVRVHARRGASPPRSWPRSSPPSGPRPPTADPTPDLVEDSCEPGRRELK